MGCGCCAKLNAFPNSVWFAGKDCVACIWIAWGAGGGGGRFCWGNTNSCCCCCCSIFWFDLRLLTGAPSSTNASRALTFFGRFFFLFSMLFFSDLFELLDVFFLPNWVPVGRHTACWIVAPSTSLLKGRHVKRKDYILYIKSYSIFCLI